jgi:hypothetical protein
MGKTSRVVIGMDPHKRTVTIVVMSPDEAVVDRGRFATDVVRGDAGRRGGLAGTGVGGRGL